MKSFNLLSFFIWMFGLHVCLCTTCVPGAQIGQRGHQIPFPGTGARDRCAIETVEGEKLPAVLLSCKFCEPQSWPARQDMLSSAITT